MKYILKNKIFSILTVGLITIIYLFIFINQAKASTNWNNTTDSKISTATYSGATGEDILVVFSGYKVTLNGAQNWADNLVNKSLLAKGIKTVYAVAGPDSDNYDKEIKKISVEIISADILKTYKEGARIIVIDHSSGVYPAKEFLKDLESKKGISGNVNIPGKLFYVYNLDGNVSTLYDMPPTKSNFDVFSHSISVPTSKSFYAAQAKTPKIDVPIDTTTCNTASGVSNLAKCLHMRLVNKNSTEGFSKVAADYNNINESNIQVEYLKDLAVNKIVVKSNGTCTINSAKIKPAGIQKDDWYVPGKSNLEFIVDSKDCALKEVGFSMNEEDGFGIGNDDNEEIVNLSTEKLIAPSDKFIIKITAGEEYCETGFGEDCHLYFKMTDGTNKIFESLGKPDGEIYYECAGGCHDQFIYNGVIKDTTAPNAIDVPSINSTTYNSDYKLLAPIGSLDVITKDKTVGDYLNIIFKLGIGLLIALSVIMLVIHGIQYMGDESVFGKTEAMHSIRATIGGLILALGAYAILNTINPDLVNGSLDIKKISLDISADETSTGSSTTLCISPTNPPNPDDAKGTEIQLNSTIISEYIPARDKINASLGVKLLITAQTAQEGFFPTSLSYITHNPGNIGNTDDGKIKKFNSLQEGIQAQSNIIDIVVGGKQSSYTIGGTYECALGNEKYDGSLYQYLRIYSTGARKGNAYVNTIIGYFKANNKTITARTKMSEIKNIQ